MKKCLILFYFLLCVQLLYGQDDSGRSVVTKTTGDSNIEIIFHDKYKKVATVKTFNKTDVLETEESYSDYNYKQKQGFTKCYYPSGQTYWICDYNKNKANGEFRVYYESGTLKRKEFYKRGIRRTGLCFDENENEISFFDFFRPADFPKGIYALQMHIRRYLKSNKVGSITQFANIGLTINSDSVAVLNLLFPSELTPLAVINNMITAMPKWSPASYDGISLASVYSLNLVFSHGQVYIAELTPRFSNGSTLPTHNKDTVIPTSPPPFPERKRNKA